MAVKKVGSENWRKGYLSKADLILLRNERSFFVCVGFCVRDCVYISMKKLPTKPKKRKAIAS